MAVRPGRRPQDRSGADAVVLDLEHSVAESNRPTASQKLRELLQARPVDRRNHQPWVRINALDDSPLVDLATVVGSAPDGIDGRMFDIPHLKRARNLLDLQQKYSSRSTSRQRPLIEARRRVAAGIDR